MHARLITVNIQPAKFEEFAETFSKELLPAISREHGFKCMYVMKDGVHDKITVLAVWDSESDAKQSIEGYLSQRLPKVADFLAGQPNAETLEVILRA
jgi:heme-degrading monooxygenase HmoA